MQFTTNSAFNGNLIQLRRVDSTNNYAKELLANSGPVPEGTVIMAEKQFAGRGQRQNSWQAEPGKNLTVSIILQPSFLKAAEQFQLNKVVSLSVCDVLRQIVPGGVAIKWPNDLYIGERKTAGILIENFLNGEKLKSSVVGIGINVNQVRFPGLERATSLKLESGKEYDLTELLGRLCGTLESRYFQLRNGKAGLLGAEYQAALLGYSEERMYQCGAETFPGKITGVSEDGRLELDTFPGSRRFGMQEITFLPKS